MTCRKFIADSKSYLLDILYIIYSLHNVSMKHIFIAKQYIELAARYQELIKLMVLHHNFLSCYLLSDNNYQNFMFTIIIYFNISIESFE